MVVVLKGYISRGKLVDLPAQTAALLTHLGFDLRIVARAWLVERKEHAGLFGQTVVQEKSRESFFRRLAVKKGSPRIPFETVLFAQKPELETIRRCEKCGGTRTRCEGEICADRACNGWVKDFPQEPGGGIDAAVTSPPYAESLRGDDAKDYDAEKIDAAKATGKTAARATWGVNKGSTGTLAGKGYGHSPGQLGALPAGDLGDVLKEDAPWAAE